MRLRQTWQNVRSSFWFLPGVLVLCSIIVALALIEAGGYVGDEVVERWPRVFGAGAAGARGLLTTVATSMITVAGVVFSITIVALSLASNQYSPRVLRNFMSDRVNQTVLGVFLGIFAYCLVVMRTIREGDDDAFMPSLAVLFGLLLALVGVAVLIYFIHHIATSIQASQILATVTDETFNTVNNLFPEGVGEEATLGDAELTLQDRVWHCVFADETGYIQNVDTEDMLEFADERNVIVRMDRGIGQFVIEGTQLASVLGTAPPSDEDRQKLCGLYAIDRQRTVEQDASFGIRQIVDVALKALSPGVNDTTTAVICIDYLTAIMARVSCRRIESRYRAANGQLRLLTTRPTYRSLLGDALDQIRQNAGGNATVIECLLRAVEIIAGKADSASRREALLEHVQAIVELGQRTIASPRDRKSIDEQMARTVQALDVEPGACTSSD